MLYTDPTSLVQPPFAHHAMPARGRIKPHGVQGPTFAPLPGATRASQAELKEVDMTHRICRR